MINIKKYKKEIYNLKKKNNILLMILIKIIIYFTFLFLLFLYKQKIIKFFFGFKILSIKKCKVYLK